MVYERVDRVREMAKFSYGSDRSLDKSYRSRELVKSQLYVELIEKYDYPLYMIEVGRLVRIGDAGSRFFTEVDVVVDDRKKGEVILFAVVEKDAYEGRMERAFRELFDIANTFFAVEKSTIRLVYFTRSHSRSSGELTRCMSVSFNDYFSFENWAKDGMLHEENIPSYQPL